jgi:serine phosphatase RsbU (regulator of sigma subunit)
MLKNLMVLFSFFFFLNAVIAQDQNELKGKSDEEKFEYINDTSRVLLRKQPELAREYYQLGIKTAKEIGDQEKMADYTRKIGSSYYYERDYGQCSTYTQKAINLASEIEAFTVIASSYHRFATMNYVSHNFEKAIEAFELAVENTILSGDSTRVPDRIFMIGVCHYMMGNYPEALEDYQKALIITEKGIGNKSTQGNILNNIANIQDELKNYPLALAYYQQALDVWEELDNEKYIYRTSENMATIYSQMGEYEKALELYMAVKEYKISNDDEDGLSTTLMNIGFVNEKLGKFQSALDYYTQSLQLLYKLDDNQNIAVCLNNIGDIYYALGKYNQAIDSSKKSLVIAKKLNSKTSIKASALSLTKSFEKNSRFKEAYYNHILYSQVKDSLFNEESAKILQEMETKYQTEKKEQEIEKQQLAIEKKDAEARTRNIVLYAVFGGLILMILIAIQVFRGYKQKKRANALLSVKNMEIEQKNEFLNQANEEITEQKAEIEEKNLNIMDSIRYAKRIQQTILPRDQFVEKYLPKSFILYKPKDIVSGDFYWMEVVDNTAFVSAVDCTGHGVPGAFVSIVGYNSLNRTVMEFDLKKPSDILNKLNDLVVDTFVRHSDSDVKDGMDMSLVSIDLDTMKVEFAGAQNSAYVVNEEGLVEYSANKQPIGSSLEPKDFTNHELETKKGDMIYLFSDGYIDQFGGPKGKKFMRKRFKELLQSIHKMDVKTQKQHLDNTIIDWMGREEQLDDILVIGIRV